MNGRSLLVAVLFALGIGLLIYLNLPALFAGLHMLHVL